MTQSVFLLYYRGEKCQELDMLYEEVIFFFKAEKETRFLSMYFICIQN